MAKIVRAPRRGIRQRHDSVLEIFDESGRLLAEVARLSDVSSVGISFTTTRAFSKGEKIRGRLRLMNAGVLEIKGKVVRIKERTNTTLYAVEFDEVKGVRPWTP